VNLSGNRGEVGILRLRHPPGDDLRREPVVADTDATVRSPTSATTQTTATICSVSKGPVCPDGSRRREPGGELVPLVVSDPVSIPPPASSTTANRTWNGFVNLGWRQTGSRTGRTVGSRSSRGPSTATLAELFRSHGRPDLQLCAGYHALQHQRRPELRSGRRQAGLPAATLGAGWVQGGGPCRAWCAGHENFQSFNAAGAGPASNSPLDGNDVAVYVQTQLAPSEQWELRHRHPLRQPSLPHLGQRARQPPISSAPGCGSAFSRPRPPRSGPIMATVRAHQHRGFCAPSPAPWDPVPGPSPRCRSATTSSSGTHPPLPGRDRDQANGLSQRSSPGIDDTQVPGTAITTDVNIDQVRITGLETSSRSVQKGPVTGFVNAGLAHAYGFGEVTGGFFTVTPPPRPSTSTMTSDSPRPRGSCTAPTISW